MMPHREGTRTSRSPTEQRYGVTATKKTLSCVVKLMAWCPMIILCLRLYSDKKRQTARTRTNQTASLSDMDILKFRTNSKTKELKRVPQSDHPILIPFSAPGTVHPAQNPTRLRPCNATSASRKWSNSYGSQRRW